MNIDKPGLYADLDEAEYHADPVAERSLSQSGAKLILDCPARYQQAMLTPRTSRAFDEGHSAHAHLLGKGSTIVTIPDEMLSGANRAIASADAKKWVADARAAGQVPVKSDITAKAGAMVDAVRRHAVAGLLFREGAAEQSIFWRDAETHIMLRARLDWLTTLPSGRPVIVDYKTTDRSCATSRFSYSARDFGYYIQDPWYREALASTGIEDPAFLFVVQETSAPYLVNVVELCDDDRDVGARHGRAARRIFAECMTTGHWPGYPERVQSLRLPPIPLIADPTDISEGEAA